MELWRIIAAVLLAGGGLTLMLLFMAKARESRGGDTTKVLATGGISLFVTAVLVGMVATALPALACWVLVALVLLTVSVLAMAS